MKKAKSVDHYIYFLIYNKKVTKEFLDISLEMKNWKIEVIPISPLELRNLANSKKQFVISLTSDLISHSCLTRFRKDYLDFTLMRKNYGLINISSFPKISNYHKLENINCYHHIALPVKLRELCRNVAKFYFDGQVTGTKWPGGKRATLPM